MHNAVSQLFDAIPFLELRQQHCVQVDRPDTIVGLFEADLFIAECNRKLEELVAKPERARVLSFVIRKCAGCSRAGRPPLVEPVVWTSLALLLTGTHRSFAAAPRNL